MFWNKDDEEGEEGKELEECSDLTVGQDLVSDVDVAQYKMNMLFSADEVVFGGVLEELDVYVDGPRTRNKIWNDRTN